MGRAAVADAYGLDDRDEQIEFVARQEKHRDWEVAVIIERKGNL